MSDTGIIPAGERNDLAETLKELNSDALDTKTGMSAIDMRTRLGSFEIPAILQIDALVNLGVLPSECVEITRQKKRLAVSLRGRGRSEIVQVAGGYRDANALAQGGVRASSPLGFLKRKKEE